MKNLLNNKENISKIEKTPSYIKDQCCELIRTKTKTILNDHNKNISLNKDLEKYIKHLTLVIFRYIDAYKKNNNELLEIIKKEEQESKTLLCYEIAYKKCAASLNDADKTKIIYDYRNTNPRCFKSDDDIIFDNNTSMRLDLDRFQNK